MTPHEAMVERVARAIAAARIKAFGTAAGVEPRDVEFDYARAAIEAISAGAEPVALADEIERRRLKFADVVDGQYEMLSSEEHDLIAAAIRARGQS